MALLRCLHGTCFVFVCVVQAHIDDVLAIVTECKCPSSLRRKDSSTASSFHFAEGSAIDEYWLLVLKKMRLRCLPSFIPMLPILLQQLPLNVCWG